MSEKQWVQHISGQGEKWKILFDNPYQWVAKNTQSTLGYHLLPKSEYRLCDTPQVWRDVTEECVVNEYGSIQHNGINTMCDCGYRRRKVQALIDEKSGEVVRQWVFIVEQKVTG